MAQKEIVESIKICGMPKECLATCDSKNVYYLINGFYKCSQIDVTKCSFIKKAICKLVFEET